jgi:hypothetical protein
MKYICWFYYYVELFILPFLHAVFSQISIYCVLINKQSITQVLRTSSLSFSFCFVCLTFFLSWQLSVLESLWGYQTSCGPYVYYFTKTEWWYTFSFQNGSFDNLNFTETPVPSQPGSSIGAAIAATVTIPSNAQRNVTFSLAWDCPEVKFPGGRTYYRLVVENICNKIYCLKTIDN